jgi:hypothetical protein
VLATASGPPAPIARGSLFSGTVGAETEKFKAVIFYDKTMPAGDFVLQLFDLGIFEFDDQTATAADQVVVMLLAEHQFETALPVTEIPFGGNAAFGEQLEGPMDRGIADVRIFTAHLQVELFSGQMRGLLKKFLQDDHPLVGIFQPFLRQVIGENFPKIHGSPLSDSINNENDFQYTHVRQNGQERINRMNHRVVR